MEGPTAPVPPSDAPSPEELDAAFRELHGVRLHGFALLVTLGNRSLAARLTADALVAATDQVDALRHPERAAAWLRARLVRSLPRRHRDPSPGERRAGLDPLGVDDAVGAGLSAIGPLERAALVASTVERLDRRDVETIVGRTGARLDRLLARGRRGYLATWSAAAAGQAIGSGPVAERVRSVATRTMT